MGQASSVAGLSGIVADAVSTASLCPTALGTPPSAAAAASTSSPSVLDGDGSAEGGGPTDAQLDDEWHTVTVADAAASAEDFIVTLRRDLERTLVIATRTPTTATPPTTPLSTGDNAGTPTRPPPEPRGQAAPELSSVVPNSVLVRLALLQPFMRGASVFDAFSFADKPASDTSSCGFRLSRPSVTLNGAAIATMTAFREALLGAAADAITDGAERQAVQQVLLLLVHNRFSKLCVDAAKLAFGSPGLMLAPSTVDVTCVPGNVSLVSVGVLASNKAAPPSHAVPDATGATDEAAALLRQSRPTIDMTLTWNFTPQSTPVSAWGTMMSCFRGMSSSGPDEFAAQRTPEAAAVVTFVRQ